MVFCSINIIQEKNNIITKSVILKDICFPKLYKDFFDIPLYNDLVSCLKYFPDFMNLTISSSCLIIDELIEDGFFGEDWEDFFHDTLNEMVESVFYNPEEFDFSIKPESQEKFIELLSAPVQELLYQETHITFY